jgi:ketosteroid isomerase-like protein
MRTGLLLSLLLCLAAPLVSAQSADQAAVAEAVAAFTKATLAKDRAAFEKLCAAPLVYGHSSGRAETKQEFIDDSTGPRATWKSIDISGQTVQVAGNNAVVRHTLTGEQETGGKTNAIKIGVMMVWSKIDGSWQLLARQAYRL